MPTKIAAAVIKLHQIDCFATVEDIDCAQYMEAGRADWGQLLDFDAVQLAVPTALPILASSQTIVAKYNLAVAKPPSGWSSGALVTTVATDWAR